MLSDLPDCIILHILSFLNTKEAVRTCILSVRWKNLWKHLPVLTFDFVNFPDYIIDTEFVSKVLSLRDISIPLQSLDVRLLYCGTVPQILQRIVSYAISHNVQRLGLDVSSDIAQIPASIFSFRSLTNLKLSMHPTGGHETLFLDALDFDLPALTNLQLVNITFSVGENDRAEPFSTFIKLNSLLICNCKVWGAQTLCISSATLVNLTIYNHKYKFYIIDLCTPSLCQFVFTGTPYQKLSGSDVSSLKHVDIDAEVVPYREDPPLFLLSWLLELTNIKSLTVSAATLQVLSLIPDLLKTNFPSLSNLESLKVIMEPILDGFRKTLCEVKLRKVKSKEEDAKLRRAFKKGSEPSPLIPDGIVDFLLQNSPSAEVDLIDYKRLPLRTRYL